MKETNFTLNAALSIVAALLFSVSLSAQIQMQTIANCGGFQFEVGWEIVEQGTNTVVQCIAPGGCNATPMAWTATAGNTYNAVAYDSFGDGWNAATLDIQQGIIVSGMTSFVTIANFAPVGDIDIQNFCPGSGPSANGDATVDQPIVSAPFTVNAQTCTLDCPPNQTLSMNPNFCGVLKSDLPAPTVGGCADIVTSVLSSGPQPFTCTGGSKGITTHTLGGALASTADVTVRFITIADTGINGAEQANVRGPDGVVLGLSASVAAGDCVLETATFTIPVATWNGWITTFGPDLDFTWDAAAAINCFCGPDVVTIEADITFATGLPFLVNAPDSIFGSGAIAVEYCALDATLGLICCETVFTVEDLVAPVFLSCPSDQTYNLLPGECEIVVSWTSEAEDNCPPTVDLTPLGGIVVAEFVNCNNGAASLETRHFRTFTPLSDIRVDSMDVGISTDFGNHAYDFNIWDNTNGNFPAGLPDVNIHSSAHLTTGAAGSLQRINIGGVVLTAGVEYVFEVYDPGQAPAWSPGYGPNNQPSWLWSPSCGAGVPTLTTNLIASGNGLVLQIATIAGGATVSDCPAPEGPNPFVSGDLIPIGSHDFCYVAVDGNNNEAFCRFNITVNEYPNPTRTLATNDLVHFSLDPDGGECNLVTTDMVLEGGPYGCYDNYFMTRTPAFRMNAECMTPAVLSGCPGEGTGYFGFVPVDCADIGKTITVRIVDTATCNVAWATLVVEDKVAPVIVCEDITIACNQTIEYGVLTTNTSSPAVGTQPAFDAATRDFTMSVTAPNTATVDKVTVDLDISHTFVADLDIFVIAPDGTEVPLFQDQCGAADNVDVTIDDDGAAFACGGNPVVSGVLRPQGTAMLADFIGLLAAGDWTLRVRDDAGADVTNINSLTLNVTWTGSFEEPTVFDNCYVQEYSFIDSQGDGTCADGTVGTIRRKWTAKDAQGNTTSCDQIITIDRPGLGDVTFPEGITHLDCSTENYPDPGTEVCVKDTLAAMGLNIGPFPDPGTGGITFDIENGADESRIIKDLNIRLAIDHGDVSELQISIARLDALGNIINGTVTQLYTAVPNDNYVACSVPIQMGIDITFDDEGCPMPHEPCADFAPSIAGQYIPANPLSLYDGQRLDSHLNPDWVLLITDIDGPGPTNSPNGFPVLQDIEIVYIYQDADVIEVPTIAGNPFETGDVCGLTVSYVDEKVDVCPTTYKIIRTWTVIDWCTGEREVRDQLIKVIDTCPPVLEAPRSDNDDRFTLDIPVYSPSIPANGAHHACTGNAVLPPITVCSDNCSGTDASTWVTTLYSADGNTLLGSNPSNGGTFNDLILDLDEGPNDDKAPGILRFPDLSTPNPFDTITIQVDSETLREPDAIYLARYEVSDNCGNTASADVYIRLLDKVPPIPVIREETQLALQGNLGDTTALCAGDLDEGSYDNCSNTHFFLRKMMDDNDTDPIGNVDFGFGPDPTLTFEIFGRDGQGRFDLARDYIYKCCTSYTCDDIGEDNRVFVLVVDDYVVNFINDYLSSVFEFVDAIVDYSQVPLTILPADTNDDEQDAFIFRSLTDFDISVDADRRNRGKRYFEFYLNEDPRGDGLFIIPTALLWEGHFNFAMVNVHVEDKVRPECRAPEDVWINCDALQDNIDFDDNDQLDDLFGTAIVFDNCNAELQYLSVDADLDLCGVGQITRSFRAEDDFGNRSLGNCRQTIMVMPVTSYEIMIPGDFQEECDDASPASVQYSEFGCDLLAMTIEDEDFDASPLGECKKIFRTYKLINWCEYDGASPAVVIPRLDLNNDGSVGDGNGGSRTPVNHSATNTWQSNGGNLIFVPNTQLQIPGGGYYSYEQHIKIFDNTAPNVSYDGDTKFCGGDLDEDPCTGQVDIDVNASDLCTNTTTLWELDAFSDSFVSADDDGNGGFSGRLPLGTHSIRFTVADECGNFSWEVITFEVVDCKAPTPVCHNGLSIDVMPLSGMVELWASDFDASSFDYCHPFELRINTVTDRNGDGVITADDYVTTLPPGDNIVVTCADVQAGLTMVQLWVHELSTDGMMDDDYCVTFVEVQDNNGVCAGSRPLVGGKIANEEGEAVENVAVEINSGMAAMTTVADGEYNFSLPEAGDYTIAPMRMDDVANGVTTFDLIKISRHILNVELLDSPYKIIAADANNSANISTVDLIAIRKVILRVAADFPNNTSWRFVDKAYTFTNPAKPLSEKFDEVINLNNLTSNVTDADFVAVKVGDVNGDATPNSILGVDGRTFNGNMIFNASEQSVEAGEEFTVAFTAAQDVDGYQFTLDYNEKAVELVDVVEGLATAANFNVAEGQIATSWNQDVSTKGQVMFSLVFRAKDAIEVSNVMSVNSAITAAEAYNANGDLMGISLEFDGAAATAQFELAQNTPNPFKTETVIGFTLPEASNATITVSDVTGKVLKVVTGDFAKGYNQVSMKRADLGVATGVLSYRLEANGNTATKQMIVIE